MTGVRTIACMALARRPTIIGSWALLLQTRWRRIHGQTNTGEKDDPKEGREARVDRYGYRQALRPPRSRRGNSRNPTM
jgi:hypothetical protein